MNFSCTNGIYYLLRRNLLVTGRGTCTPPILHFEFHKRITKRLLRQRRTIQPTIQQDVVHSSHDVFWHRQPVVFRQDIKRYAEYSSWKEREWSIVVTCTCVMANNSGTEPAFSSCTQADTDKKKTTLNCKDCGSSALLLLWTPPRIRVWILHITTSGITTYRIEQHHFLVQNFPTYRLQYYDCTS